MPAGSPVRLATEVCMRSSSRRILRAVDDDESGAGELHAPADALQEGVPVSFKVAICWETARRVS